MKGSTHALASPEIAVTAIPEDERVWVPQAKDVWFRPLMLNAQQGQWRNLLSVRKSGVLSRHLHPNPVHGFVLKGKWFYREHDWSRPRAPTCRAARRDPYADRAGGYAGDDHVLQHPGIDGVMVN